MFHSARDYRTFLTVVMTYTLDTIGFSLVFPVLAPLLLNPNLHFFPADTPEIERTTLLGVLFAAFGFAQFFGASISGALADHYGRYKVFIGTIALSVVGYALMAMSVYVESLGWLFFGRMLTGFCSGNIALAQSATADLTDSKHRSKAFGILLGVGGLGFVAGPWVGGKLANPDWLMGSGAFIFAAITAFLNLLMVFFFFTETWKPHKGPKASLLATFKDIRLVFHQKTLRVILISNLLLVVGWAFYLVFSPTYLVQRFSLKSDQIGDFFAYMAVCWCFFSVYLNKELSGKFSLRSLILVGLLIAAASLILFLCPSHLWPYWVILPFNQLGAALSWINLGATLSAKAPSQLQGRAMGAAGSSWSFGQAIAPLIAGPLAGWNIYAPLTVGAAFILLAFFYFGAKFKHET